MIRKVERRTRFLTFSSLGADEIGPYIASATLAWPDLVRDGDQMDLVMVLGGLSDNGGRELVAAGFGYRQELPGSGATLYFNIGSRQVIHHCGMRRLVQKVEGCVQERLAEGRHAEISAIMFCRVAQGQPGRAHVTGVWSNVRTSVCSCSLQSRSRA